MTYELQKNIHHYVGKSTDDKPSGNILLGSFLYETDTTRTYRWNGESWEPILTVSVSQEQRITDDRGAELLSEILDELTEMNIHLRTLVDEPFERVR